MYAMTRLPRDHGIERGRARPRSPIPELGDGGALEHPIHGCDVLNDIGVIGLRVLRQQGWSPPRCRHWSRCCATGLKRAVPSVRLLRRQCGQAHCTQRHEQEAEAGALNDPIAMILICETSGVQPVRS